MAWLGRRSGNKCSANCLPGCCLPAQGTSLKLQEQMLCLPACLLKSLSLTGPRGWNPSPITTPPPHPSPTCSCAALSRHHHKLPDICQGARAHRLMPAFLPLERGGQCSAQQRQAGWAQRPLATQRARARQSARHPGASACQRSPATTSRPWQRPGVRAVGEVPVLQQDLGARRQQEGGAVPLTAGCWAHARPQTWCTWVCNHVTSSCAWLASQHLGQQPSRL